MISLVTMMETVIAIFPLLLPVCHGFLNIEELNDMKYSLDIMDKPLNSMEINGLDGMKLASRHGQDYYCKLPVKAVKAAVSTEDEATKIPKDTPISVLLEPLRKTDCLKLIKGWWTYEFCYGIHIKQYHSEDGSLLGDTIYLGFYESDFDWTNKQGDQNSQLRRHKLQRYHSQKYVNGTSCDLIHHQRDTEIRFTCDDSSTETYISRVDEPSTCSYVITIATPYICSHPYTRPMPSKKPFSIQCYPVLTPDQIVEYEKMTAAETEEQLKLHTKHIQLQTQLKGLIEQNKQILLSNTMTEAVHQLMPEQDLVEEDATANEEKNKFLGDLKEFLGSVMEKDKVQKILKKFHKEHELKKKKEELRNQAISMIERFIVEERLQNINTIKQSLLVMNVVDLMLQNSHLPTADVARIIEVYVTKYIETEEHFRGEEQKLERMARQLDSLIPEFGNPDGKAEATQKDDENDPVLKVKLKVRKLKTLDDLTSIPSEEALADDFEEVNQDPAWQKLEEELGRGLENAGVGGTGGGEIEIRIITNQDIELGLGEVDGNRFSSILLDMLGGSAARMKETKRQKKLVINYNRIWKKDTSTFQILEDNESDNDVNNDGENSVL